MEYFWNIWGYFWNTTFYLLEKFFETFIYPMPFFSYSAKVYFFSCFIENLELSSKKTTRKKAIFKVFFHIYSLPIQVSAVNMKIIGRKIILLWKINWKNKVYQSEIKIDEFHLKVIA